MVQEPATVLVPYQYRKYGKFWYCMGTCHIELEVEREEGERKRVRHKET